MKKFLLLLGINLLSIVVCAEIKDKLFHIIKDIEHFNFMCKHKMNYTLSECFMIKTVQQLEKSLNNSVIKLNENARLVEISSENEKYHHSKNVGYERSFLRANLSQKYPRTWQSWATAIITRLKDVFKTHVLHLNILPAKNEDVTARHRRRHQMLPMMLLGVVSVATVIIPMGFQFLAVIAGKSFLMAKMALIMSSVNGLKRVASSGVHYGLYHTDGYHYPHSPPPASHFSQYWHDRDGIGRAE